MRTHREQFSQETAERITLLIQSLERLRYPTGPSRYYGLELAACLGVGALAGSLLVASALMELYVRGLVVRYVEAAQSGWARQVEAERELENMSNFGFQSLINRLVESDLFDSEDAKLAKEIYNTVRIPAHHCLPSRLIGKPNEGVLQAILGEVGRAGPVSMRDFEDFIESEALPTVETIVTLLARNQYKEDA